MNLVVEAAVAVRWFIAAPGWEPARALKEPGVKFFAPELILAEIATLCSAYAAQGSLGEEDAKLVVNAAPRAFTRLFPIMLLRDRALTLSVELDIEARAGFYLALAEWEGVPLVTDDERLVRATQSREALRVLPLEAAAEMTPA